MSFMDATQDGDGMGWSRRLARRMFGMGDDRELEPWQREERDIDRAGNSRRLAQAMLESNMQTQPFGITGGLTRALNVFGASRAFARADDSEQAAEDARDSRMSEAVTGAGAARADGTRPTYAEQITALGANADPRVRRLATQLATGRLERGAEREVDDEFARALEQFKSNLNVDEAERMTPVLVDRERNLGPVQAENAGLRETSVRTAAEPFEIRSDQRSFGHEERMVRLRASVGATADGPLSATQARALAGAYGTDWEQATSASRAILSDPKVALVLSPQGQQLIRSGDAAAIGALRYAMARFANGPGALSTPDVTMTDGSTIADSVTATLNSVAGRGRMSGAQAERIIGVLQRAAEAEQASVNQHAQFQRSEASRAGVPTNMLGLVTPLWQAPAAAPAAGAGSGRPPEGGAAPRRTFNPASGRLE